MRNQTGQAGRSTADRCARACIAAIVILASAGTGFVASRLWPWPTRDVQTRLPNPNQLTFAASVPSQPFDIAPPAQPSAIASLPNTPRNETVTSASTPASVPYNVINPDAAEQPTAAAQPLESIGGDAQRDNPNVPPVARPRAEKVKKPRIDRSRGTGETTANVTQVAPPPSGYQHDRAMREFMSPDQNSSR